MSKDKELTGNEIIEKKIYDFSKEHTEEALANLLSAIRKQMKAGASLVVAIDADFQSGMKLKEVSLKDGRSCGMVFTSFEEQMKGTSTVSTFMVEMGQLFAAVLANEETDGLLLNGYGYGFFLDKTFIRLIMG